MVRARVWVSVVAGVLLLGACGRSPTPAGNAGGAGDGGDGGQTGGNAGHRAGGAGTASVTGGAASSGGRGGGASGGNSGTSGGGAGGSGATGGSGNRGGAGSGGIAGESGSDGDGGSDGEDGGVGGEGGEGGAAEPAFDLTVTQSNEARFIVGMRSALRITVTNLGPATPTGNVVVTNTLPSGFAYAGPMSATWTCSAASGVVTCTHPASFGASLSLPILELSVQPTSVQSSPFTNTAHVAHPGDASPDNDTSTASIVVEPPIELAIDVSHVGTFTHTANGSFDVAVSNVGPTATYRRIVVACSSAPTWTGAGRPIDWDCYAAGLPPTLVCQTTTSLPPGGSVALSVSVGTTVLLQRDLAWVGCELSTDGMLGGEDVDEDQATVH